MTLPNGDGDQALSPVQVPLESATGVRPRQPGRAQRSEELHGTLDGLQRRGEELQRRIGELQRKVDELNRQREEMQQKGEQLEAALASSRVTATAVGILMERSNLDRAAAWAQLVQLSQHSNTKLFMVAQQILLEAGDPSASRG